MGAMDPHPLCATKLSRPSSIFICLLRWLDHSVLLASILTIVCVLALQVAPSAWGWAFLFFSFLSIASAVVGRIAAADGASSCLSLHVFLLITSACLQCSVFLLVTSRPDAALARMQSNRSEINGRAILKVDAALLLWIFCAQMLVLAMSCLLHFCEPVDYYEDLEGDRRAPRRGSRRLSRVQEESIADARTESAMKTVSLSQKEMREENKPEP